MKYLHTLAITLLVVASTPALAVGNPAPQEPPEHFAQKLEQNANPASGAARHEAARAAQVEQLKQAMVDTLKASASNGPGGMLQDPSVKPQPAAGDILGGQFAKIADLIARRQAGEKPGREQSEALRELVKQRVHEVETRPGTLQLNWLDLPQHGMSEEDARAAGYPCIGPDDASAVADTSGQMTARGNVLDAETGAKERLAEVAYGMAAFAAHQHDEHRARHRTAGQDSGDCPHRAEGMRTGDNRTDIKAKDYYCVDCPDQQVA